MPKKAEAQTKIQGITCPNPKCGRTFTNPITVQDLGSKDEVTYQACPYCLAEIVIGKTVESQDDQERKAEPREKSKVKYKKEKQDDSKQTPQISVDSDECPYHFGYLSERSKGEGIPEECMTCPKLVQCMFQKTS